MAIKTLQVLVENSLAWVLLINLHEILKIQNTLKFLVIYLNFICKQTHKNLEALWKNYDYVTSALKQEEPGFCLNIQILKF